MQEIITVFVMTYNHKNYIKQCLDSIFSQKVSVPYKILIHDDHSDDGTYEILLEYKEKYGAKVEIIEQKERKFLIDGFNGILEKYVAPKINTKYIAYCDGDDYWIDENKLEKQYKYFENNHDCSLLFHSAYCLERDGSMKSRWFLSKERDYFINDFIGVVTGTPIPTSSIFLKSDLFKTFPKFRQICPVEDFPLYLLACTKGRIHKFYEPMSIYRKFSVGSWSETMVDSNERDKIKGQIKNTLDMFNVYTNFEYTNLIDLDKRYLEFKKMLRDNDLVNIFCKENKVFFRKLPFKYKIFLRIKRFRSRI